MNIKKIILITIIFFIKNIIMMNQYNNDLENKLNISNTKKTCPILIQNENNINYYNQEQNQQQNELENHQEEDINYIPIQNEINNQINLNNLNNQEFFFMMKNCFIVAFITGVFSITTFFTFFNKTINK
jgi:hypothetical protein